MYKMFNEKGVYQQFFKESKKMEENDEAIWPGGMASKEEFEKEQRLLDIERNSYNVKKFLELYLEQNGMKSFISTVLSDILINFLEILIIEKGFTKSYDGDLLKKVLKKYLDIKKIDSSDFDDRGL